MASTMTPQGDKPDLTQPVATNRRVKNILAHAWWYLGVLLAFIPLVLVIAYVIVKGAPIISWTFLTSPLPVQDRQFGGIWPAIVGTIIITAAATVMAVPLGILAAVYLNEYGRKGKLAQFIRTLSDVMTGVPSIVMGLFIYAVWVLTFESTSGFAGSLALACLMLPVVINSTEEMLRLVPDQLREGSYALGGRRWRTTLSVVIPAALPGITSGSLLAIARAAGETAPLLFTIGFVTETNWNLFEGSNTALPFQIFRLATSPFPEAQDRAWGAALVLIFMVLVLSMGARWISRRFTFR